MKANSETRVLGTFSASSIRNLLPKSLTTKQRKAVTGRDRENTPPRDPNVVVNHSLPVKQLSKIENPDKIAAELDSESEVAPPLDPAVKVVVRIKPVNNDHEKEGDQTVRKVSPDSLCVGDRKFTFDSVLDSKSNQEDVFQLVGAPAVKNALAGYNTSILLYGQTGSGKTYTMWGPPSAMVEDPSPSSQQGIVPRIFQTLFSEIQREQENLEGKQTSFQCRCSFLEVYNEKIGDLLDPTQRNLQIRDDAKYGFYVENLTEEYVNSYEDVAQILIKGLSSRKVGTTSTNSKSSRSHIIFTCIIDSWCEGTSSKCFSSSRTARISFVDLAGMDTKKIDYSSRDCVREGKSVKKSLSRLGYLVSILAKETHSEKIPYRSSCLTHLMRESLGGNAKLTVICAITPDKKSTGETVSTLRFGKQAKSIRNEPVINEITEDDVNDLSDQIRQLKEELKRAKSSVNQTVGSNNGYFKGRNVRDSLNHLTVSINRSLILPRVDGDSERDINVDEDDVKELCLQLDNSHRSNEPDNIYYPCGDESFETDLASENFTSCADDGDNEEISSNIAPSRISDHEFRKSISISCQPGFAFQEPILTESPKFKKPDAQNRSMAMHSSFSESRNNETVHQSLKQSEHIRSSLRSSNVWAGGPTESLAASLQRGLQIIDYHQRNSTSRKSVVAFSFEHLALKPCSEVDEAHASSFVCAFCQRSENNEDKENDFAQKREELEILCKEQAAKIVQLNSLVDQYKHKLDKTTAINLNPESINFAVGDPPKNEIVLYKEPKYEGSDKLAEQCKMKDVLQEHGNTSFDLNEKEELLKEIERLRNNLQSFNDSSSINKSVGRLRSSLLLSHSIHLQKCDVGSRDTTEEELEMERKRWTEMESDWISLTDELRIDLESHRRRAEKVEMELKLEKNCTEELNDVLQRSVMGHARMIEHYAELQEKHNVLVEKHRMIMVGIAEVKKAAAKAGAKGGHKGNGSRFAKYMAAELSTSRVEKEKEREFLKKENKSLRIQLRETAEAVHAAGEILVRLREAEEAASVSEANYMNVQQENEKLKKQIEKIKRKHKMELVTMKQYLAESRLPESALRPIYKDDSNMTHAPHNSNNTGSFVDDYDDQAWRAEFGPVYQNHHY